MNRYPTNSTTKRYDGKRVQQTTYYPPIPVSPNDIYIIATDSDYLDGLAQNYYHDATLWWIIAQANKIIGTLKAPTGQQLRIPMNIQSIVTTFFSENR